MRLTPPEPSFLDVRNAILQARGRGRRDHVEGLRRPRHGLLRGLRRQRRHDAESRLHRHRRARRDRRRSRHGRRRGRRRRRRRDGRRRRLRHGLGMHSDVTDADGDYSRSTTCRRLDRPPRYPEVRARKPGYKEAAPRRRGGGGEQPAPRRCDFQLARDFSSAAPAPSGAELVAFTAPTTRTSGCGPGGLIDDDHGTRLGQQPRRGRPGADLVGQEIVVELAAPIDVGRVAIDPGAGCGDDATASLGAYEVLGARTPERAVRVAGAAERSARATSARWPRRSAATRPASATSSSTRRRRRAPTGSGAQFLDVAEMHVRGCRARRSARSPTPAPRRASARRRDADRLVVPHGAPAQVVIQYGDDDELRRDRRGGQHAGGRQRRRRWRPRSAGSSRRRLPLPRRRRARRPRAPRREPDVHHRRAAAAAAAADATRARRPSEPAGRPEPAVGASDPAARHEAHRRAARARSRSARSSATPRRPATLASRCSAPRQAMRARARRPVRIGGNVTKTLRLTKKARRAIRPGRSKQVTLELRLPNGRRSRSRCGSHVRSAEHLRAPCR